MKRTINTCIATFVVGLLVGAGTLYFSIGRGQTQIIEQSYSGSLIDRVLIAAKLRAGKQQSVLTDSEYLIGRGVTAVDQIAHGTDSTQHALQLAKAYYEYHSLPIPDSAKAVLAHVEPVSKQSFEGLRDMQLATTK